MNITDTEKENIYRDFSGKIYSYVRSKISSPETAEDLTSDVFLKVYEKLDTYDEKRSSLSTWIYTIARNTLTDYFRTNKVAEEIPEDLDDGSSIEETVCNNAMLEILADALEQLEERERTVIIRHYYHGKKLKEIAEELHISYAYVKIIKNKALNLMKKAFD